MPCFCSGLVSARSPLPALASDMPFPRPLSPCAGPECINLFANARRDASRCARLRTPREERSAHVLRRHQRDAPVRLLGDACDVRRQQQVRRFGEARAARRAERLVREDIERGRRRGVPCAARRRARPRRRSRSRGVDEQGVRRHQRERGGVDQPARRVRERDVDAQRVAHAQQSRWDRLDALGDRPGVVVRGEIGVDGGDSHPEGARALGDCPCDRPEADQPEPRAGQLAPAEFLPRPRAGHDARGRAVDGAPQRQHRRSARTRRPRRRWRPWRGRPRCRAPRRRRGRCCRGRRRAARRPSRAGAASSSSRSTRVTLRTISARTAATAASRVVARLGEAGLVAHVAIAPQALEASSS